MLNSHYPQNLQGSTEFIESIQELAGVIFPDVVVEGGAFTLGRVMRCLYLRKGRVDREAMLSEQLGSNDEWHHELLAGGVSIGYSISCIDIEGLLQFRSLMGGQLARRLAFALDYLELEWDRTDEEWLVDRLRIPQYRSEAILLTSADSQRVLVVGERGNFFEKWEVISSDDFVARLSLRDPVVSFKLEGEVAPPFA